MSSSVVSKKASASIDTFSYSCMWPSRQRVLAALRSMVTLSIQSAGRLPGFQGRCLAELW